MPAAVLALAPLVALLLAVGGCADPPGAEQPGNAGRLHRPPANSDQGRRFATPGIYRLRVDEGRPALLFVPRAVRAKRPLPLVIMLHGSGGRAASALRLLRREAQAQGTAVLAPASRGRTWDVVLGGFGPDVETIDSLLVRVARGLPIDSSRMTIAGFSDGASYALSLGLTNGDLFDHVVAFSPGFAAPVARRGRPAVFVSHGVRDGVLPIDRTSRQLVPDFKEDGYPVLYREFSGGHTVPPAIAAEALRLAAAPE